MVDEMPDDDKLESMLHLWGDRRAGRRGDRCLNVSAAELFARQGPANQEQALHVSDCPACADGGAVRERGGRRACAAAAGGPLAPAVALVALGRGGRLRGGRALSIRGGRPAPGGPALFAQRGRAGPARAGRHDSGPSHPTGRGGLAVVGPSASPRPRADRDGQRHPRFPQTNRHRQHHGRQHDQPGQAAQHRPGRRASSWPVCGPRSSRRPIRKPSSSSWPTCGPPASWMPPRPPPWPRS